MVEDKKKQGSGKIDWEALHGTDLLKALNGVRAKHNPGPWNVWPESTPEEDAAYESACADYRKEHLHSFTYLMETYPASYDFPSKAVATRVIRQLLAGIRYDKAQ
jgi:hypothetical protein